MSQHARNNPEECARQAYADATRPISRQDAEPFSPEDYANLQGQLARQLDECEQDLKQIAVIKAQLSTMIAEGEK